MCLLLLESETGVVWLTEKWFCWLRKDGKLGFVFVSLMCLCDVLSVFERKRVRGLGMTPFVRYLEYLKWYCFLLPFWE